MPLQRVLTWSGAAQSASDAGRLRRSNRRVALAVVVFTAAVTLGAVAGVWFELASRQHEALEHAAIDSGNLARVFEEEMTRAIQVVDISIQSVVGRRQRELATPPPPGMVVSGISVNKAYLDGKVASVPYASALLAIDDAGAVIASTDAALAAGDYLQEPFFQFDREAHDDRLHIAAPRYYAAKQTWLVSLSRPIVKRDGSFGGVVVAMIDPAYFERGFEGIDIGRHGSVGLFLRDGTLFAHYPHLPFEDVARLRKTVLFVPYLAHSEHGTFERKSNIDQLTRVYSYRALRELPLVVTAGVAEDVIFADWWRSLRIYGALIVTLIGVSCSLCFLVLRELRRSEDLMAKLTASEAAMREKSTILEATLEHMDQGIYLVTGDGNLIAHNRRYEELFGVAFDNTEPLPIGAFVKILMARGVVRDAEEGQRLMERYRRAAAGEFLAWERPQASGRTLELRANPVPGGGFVVTATDITERKQSEVALRELVEEAQEASRAKSNFLANMSHELRTPLNAIIGFSEVISAEMFGPLSNPRYLDYAGYINASGNHLLRLINDILDLSKAESGKLELNEEAVDLESVIQPSILFVSQQAASGGVRLAVRLPPDLPHLRADGIKLQQMLINLLSNAVKFSSRGSEVVLAAAVEPSGMLAIAVSDTGIGIAQADIPKVLEPFRQVDSALSRKFQGTGLGLSLTKRLIELHGGGIAIDSEVGSGTTVTIRFPAERVLPVAPHQGLKIGLAGR